MLCVTIYCLLELNMLCVTIYIVYWNSYAVFNDYRQLRIQNIYNVRNKKGERETFITKLGEGQKR